MKDVLFSHNTAARFWINHSGFTDNSRVPRPALDDCEYGAREIKASPLFDEFARVDGEVHVLVTPGVERKPTKDLVRHVCTEELPADAVVRIAPGVLVASPELCFLQMASVMEFAELVKFGFNICAGYRIGSSRDAAELVERPPLTTRARILDVISQSHSPSPIARARRALDYVGEGSASPMETSGTMLACLPKPKGGYAKPMPLLNQRIDYSPVARRMAGVGFARCDMYWPDQAVAVEYDSDMEHTGSERIAADAMRRSALRYDGVEVLTLSKIQTMNPALFDDFMLALDKALGLPASKNPRPDPNAQAALRKLVFGRDCWPSLSPRR